VRKDGWERAASILLAKTTVRATGNATKVSASVMVVGQEKLVEKKHVQEIAVETESVTMEYVTV